MNYLYNGVELPALPEWDRETYPYAYIYTLQNNGNYYLEYSDSANVVSGTGSCYIGPSAKTYQSVDGVWKETTLSNVFTIIWSNTDVYYSDAVEEVGGTLYLAASTPVPVGGSTTLDPTALLMGWMVGKRVAGLRKRRSVYYNLADFSGRYLASRVWTGTSDYPDGYEYEYVDFGVGEFPLSLTKRFDNADRDIATSGAPISVELHGFYPKKGSKVEIDYYFPDAELPYASQCTNLSKEIYFEIWGNNANLFIVARNNSVELSDDYYQGLFSDGYTLTPKIQDGVCVGFTFIGTLAFDVESGFYNIDSAIMYKHDALSGVDAFSMTMSHHNYDSLSIKVTPTSNDVPVVPDEPDVPDVPSGDPIAYLYPSVVLPALPEYDTAAYPYAVIVHETAQNAYFLSASNLPWERYTESAETYNDGEGVTFYLNAETENAWASFPTFHFSFEDGDNYTTIWANSDVIVPDTDTTYLSAFTPVPTSDGMVCYKGAVLPDINAVWTDEETYKYACIYPVQEAPGIYILWIDGGGFGFIESLNSAMPSVVSAPSLSYLCITDPSLEGDGVVANVWYEAEPQAPYLPIWTNSDILYGTYEGGTIITDGTTYLAASEPIPVYE